MGAFAGQVALITGASSGIGRSIALALAGEGATVCLVARRSDELARVAEGARALGARAHALEADLTDDRTVPELVCRVDRECNRLDALVHSAAVITRGTVSQAPVEEFDRQYRTNVRAPFLLTQALLPLLRRSAGQILFLNSTVGLRAQAGVAQYAATKHALRALADSLRDEVNRDGVRVVSLFLGRTATPMQAAVHASEGRPYHPERLVQPDDVARVAIALLSLPRTVEVTELSLRPATPPL